MDDHVMVELALEEVVPDVCHVYDCTGEHDVSCWGCKEWFCSDHTVDCPECADHVCAECQHVWPHTGVAYCSACIDDLTLCCSCSATVAKGGDNAFFCDSHDAHCCNDCYAGNDLCCDCSNDSSGTDASLGSSHVAPWEARGVHEAYKGYPEFITTTDDYHKALLIWGVDRDLPLNSAAADFYLLEVVQHNLDCGQIAEPMLMVMAEEARALRRDLIRTYDRAFRGYVDMAVGGELRYHIAVGSGRHLPGHRYSAWQVWKALRARGGPELLVETAALFNEIGSGGVGGKKWADAALLLHARLTGRITPEQWVDRVFTLQHNGGSFTNKIGWGPDHNQTGNEVTFEIGPAHASNPPDFQTLLKYATPQASKLFREWWLVANKNRLRWRLPLWQRHDSIVFAELREMKEWFNNFVTSGWNGTSMIVKLQAWDENPVAHAKRFCPYYLSHRFVYKNELYLRWHDLNGSTARSVVNRTLGTNTLLPTYANLHICNPSYLKWLCSSISLMDPEYHDPMFKEMVDLDITIPHEYHEAAGIGQASIFAID